MSDPRTDQDAVLIDIAVRYGQGELSDAEFVTAIREQFTGWQDIATAPKDGTRVLITNGQYMACGRWCGAVWSDDRGFTADHLTHWMPLPAPPREIP